MSLTRYCSLVYRPMNFHSSCIRSR